MRHWFVTLLLLLVVSNAMVAAHAANHVSPEAAECELCEAYTDPSPALPGHCAALPVVAAPVLSVEMPLVAPRTIGAGDFQPRAPPDVTLFR